LLFNFNITTLATNESIIKKMIVGLARTWYSQFWPEPRGSRKGL